jgi:hypothetical protein
MLYLKVYYPSIKEQIRGHYKAFESKGLHAIG